MLGVGPFHDVLGFDVAMHETCFMDGLDALDEPLEKQQAAFRGIRQPILVVFLRRPSKWIEVLEHKEGPPADFAFVNHLGNQIRIEPAALSHDPRFTADAVASRHVLPHIGRHLEHGKEIVTSAANRIDCPKASRASAANNPVGIDPTFCNSPLS